MNTDSSYRPDIGGSQRLGNLWRRLMTLPDNIGDPEQQRQVQLVMALAIAIVILGIISAITIPLASQPDAPLSSPILYLASSASVLALIAYFLARNGRYMPAVLVMTFIGIFIIWGASVSADYTYASMMIMGSLFVSLFLPGPGVILAAVVSLVALFLLPVINPEISWVDVIPAAATNIIMPALFYISRRQMDIVSEIRRATSLEERNEALTRQADEIDKVFRLAAVGDFGARAKVFEDNELGRAAEGVNAMLAQLSSLIEVAQAERSSFIDSFDGFVGMSDMGGNMLYINPAGRRIVGLDPDLDISGRAISDFQPPEEAQMLFEDALPVATEKGAWTGESWLTHADGHLIPVAQTFFIIRDDRGQPRALGTIMTDITGRRQAATNLAEALVAAKMTYVEVDLASQMLYFDENWNRIYGTLPGYEGRREMPVAVYAANHLHPDSLQAFQEGIQKAIETDDPNYEGEVYARIIRANGEEGWALGRIKVQQDAEGNTVRIIATNQDITEARLAEVQLAAQNEALGNALEELRKLITNVDFAARQLSGASESIVDIITLLAGQATASAELAEKATATAQEGDRAVNDTISAMGRIRESTQETTRRIKRLGEASQEIGEVVRLIDEIADRVTVLALNASIQAAAAGEAGRGFAVVAEEVQRLAERATNATRQIENMVKSIQGEINEAMIGVEEATQEVVGGSQLAQDAGARITDLNQAIEELSGLVQHVADTTSQQTTESLAVLAALAADLQASVSALDIPAEAGQVGSNGGGRTVTAMLVNK